MLRLRRIGAPAGNRQIAPAAEPGAGRGQHHAVGSVGQKMGGGDRVGGVFEMAHDRG